MRSKKRINSKHKLKKRITKRGNNFKLKKGKFNRNKKGGANLDKWYYYDKIQYAAQKILPYYPQQLQYLLKLGEISSLTTGNQIGKLADKCVQKPTDPYCIALAALHIP